MEIKRYPFNLPIKGSEVKTMKEQITQNDIDSNVLEVFLTNDNKPFDMTGYTNITVSILKPDNSYYADTISTRLTVLDASKGALSITLGLAAINIAGMHQGTIEVYEGDKRLTSARFSYDVVADILSSADPTATPEIPLLQGLINEVGVALERAESVHDGVNGVNGLNGASGPEGPIGVQGTKGDSGDPALVNIFDGNADGAIRGKSALNDYQMGIGAFASGTGTKAPGYSSHAEGCLTQANSDACHAEGRNTQANEWCGHAEGENTIAGEVAHAEGGNTRALGYMSHTQGFETEATEFVAFAGGEHTKAIAEASTVFGKYGEGTLETLFGIANGTSTEDMKLVFEIRFDNTMWLNGTQITSGIDGKRVEFQKSATHIQWRYVGDADWVDLVLLSDLKGIQGIQGIQGLKGDTGLQGNAGSTGTQGSYWYQGVLITGTSATATIFASSTITSAIVGDKYFNTSTGGTYECTVAGIASVAKWVYIGSIKGVTGATGTTGLTGAQGNNGATGATGQGLSITGVVANFASLPTTGVTVGQNFIANDVALMYTVTTIGPVTWSNGFDFKGINGSGMVMMDTLPLIANRINGIYYYKSYMDGSIRKIAWVEDYLGNKYSIHDYQTKLITMLPDGSFPVTPCANSYVRGLTVKGNTYINEIKNGNFASGVTGWTPTGSTLSANNNTLILTGTLSNSFSVVDQTTLLKYSIGKKIYVRAKVKVTNSSCTSIRIRAYGSTTIGTTQAIIQIAPVLGQTYTLQTVITLPSDGAGNIAIGIMGNYADNATNNGKIMEVQDVMCLDLDKHPSLSTLTADEINTRLPRYFEGMSSTGDLDIPTNPLRYLPNGVRDTIDNAVTGAVTRRTKKVALTSDMVYYKEDKVNITYIYVRNFANDGIAFGTASTGTLLGALIFENKKYKEIADAIDSVNYLYQYDSYYASGNYMRIIFPLGTTLAQAQAELVNQVLTYQLTTPTTETYNPSTDFKIYILTDVNGVMQRVMVSDYLKKVGSVADSLINGALTRYDGKTVLNGTENWINVATSAVNTISFYLTVAEIKTTEHQINSDKFVCGSSGDVATSENEFIVTINSKIYIKILKSKLTTTDVAGFKTWLASNNVAVVYQLATPTYETVDITQIQTTQGDNIIKSMNSVLPSEETITVCQTSAQVTAVLTTAIIAHGITV